MPVPPGVCVCVRTLPVLTSPALINDAAEDVCFTASPVKHTEPYTASVQMSRIRLTFDLGGRPFSPEVLERFRFAPV